MIDKYIKRKRDLVFILKDILSEDEKTITRMVEESEVGKELSKHNPNVLYEQQTENVIRISREWRKNDDPGKKRKGKMITPESVIKSFAQLCEEEKKTRSKSSIKCKRASRDLKKNAIKIIRLGKVDLTRRMKQTRRNYIALQKGEKNNDITVTK